jgi:two-component system LytT family response regulator
MIVRALIASGDPSTRHQLREFLTAYDWLECRSETEDGPAALAAMNAERFDLLFVDVELPEIGGLDLIGLSAHRPEFILLSRDGAHAEAAFEAGALDYLTRPVRPTRLAKSMVRVRQRLRPTSAPPAPRLFLRLKKELIQVGSDEVSRIEACGDYVNVHARGDRHLIHLSLKEMQRHVDPEKFLQIHRSHIINLDHVAALRPYDDRRFVVALSDGSAIVASRAGTRLLKRLTLD